MLKITIVGAGSIGLFLAAKCCLAQSAKISLITRTEEQKIRISSAGIHLDEKGQKYRVNVPVASFSGPRTDADLSEKPDWILLTVKQQHLNDRLLAFLKQICHSETKIICFQNGIGHIEKFSGIFSEQNIYTAVTTEAALKKEAHHVIHTGFGMTWIGSEKNNIELERPNLEQICVFFEKIGLDCILSLNIIEIIWRKLLMNLVINPVTALMRLKNGQLLQSDEALNVMSLLYKEGRRVCDEAGISLPSNIWDSIIDVCKKTADNESSMLQDLSQGKTTEIEWINGSIMRLADGYQLQVPVIRTVYFLIKGMEKRVY